MAVNCKKNGSIEMYSHEKIKKLVDRKPSAIVIIYDEHDLQHLIDFVSILGQKCQICTTAHSLSLQCKLGTHLFT